MANKKISQLPAAANVAAANVFPQVAAGVTEQATITQLRTNLGFDGVGFVVGGNRFNFDGSWAFGPSNILQANGDISLGAGVLTLRPSLGGDASFGNGIYMASSSGTVQATIYG